MYFLYKKTRTDAGIRYDEIEKVCLFGCKQGYIPWLLQHKLKPNDNEPFKWHIDVLADLHNQNEDGFQDTTLVIDLKPKQNKTNTSLYEVMDVWGYSADVWSPVMLRLTGLFIDAPPVNRQSFTLSEEEKTGPIYEFLYVDGTVRGGKIIGKWNPPPVSPTNAALLFPEALNYFIQCIHKTTPAVIQINDR